MALKTTGKFLLIHFGMYYGKQKSTPFNPILLKTGRIDIDMQYESRFIVTKIKIACLLSCMKAMLLKTWNLMEGMIMENGIY